MRGLEILFLGTGTSTGVPMIGCDCPVCTSSDPRDNRTRSSVIINAPDASWVIDTGPEFREQCLREKIRHLDAAVFTHAHTDHVMGFDDLRRFSTHRDERFPIYGSAETLATIRNAFHWAFAEDAPHYYLRPEAREINGGFSIGETRLEPMNLPHGRFTSTGFLLTRDGRKLAAYCNDCSDVPAEAREMIRGVEILVLDGLRHEPHYSHMTVDQALEVAMDVTPGKTYLTHICHSLKHDETQAQLPANVYLAYDGLRVRAGAE